MGRDWIGWWALRDLIRPVATRAEARRLLVEIAEQGEGHQVGAETSHFQRFLAIYRELAAFDPALVYLHNIPPNPTTASSPASEATPMANQQSRRWAQVLNLRYRLLLKYLWHFLRISGPLFTTGGDRTPHGWLVIATFHEMSHVKEVSELLVRLDLDGTGSMLRAGPPFELPYTLALPERERDRWRGHLDVLVAIRQLLDDLASTANPASATNAQEQAILASLSEHQLRGGSPNFKSNRTIPLGWVQSVKPNNDFPEIRFRFTPPGGEVYGAGESNVIPRGKSGVRCVAGDMGRIFGQRHPDNASARSSCPHVNRTRRNLCARPGTPKQRIPR